MLLSLLKAQSNGHRLAAIGHSKSRGKYNASSQSGIYGAEVISMQDGVALYGAGSN